jgi:hypothetical protein
MVGYAKRPDVRELEIEAIPGLLIYISNPVGE